MSGGRGEHGRRWLISAQKKTAPPWISERSAFFFEAIPALLKNAEPHFVRSNPIAREGRSQPRKPTVYLSGALALGALCGKHLFVTRKWKQNS